MKNIFTYTMLLLILVGCKKGFLDVKPNDSLVVPTTLADFQALLDNADYMNGYRQSGGPNPGLLLAGSDEYYVIQTRYDNFFYQHVRNAYVWDNINLYSGLAVYNDWSAPYRTVYYANVVLDGLQKLSANSNASDYNSIKGSALFYRALAFYQLAQVFAQPYNASTASNDLGIPIRLVADVSEKNTRASVQDTYNQIKTDLEEALPLVPITPLNNFRPSKPAAYALLARMYQTIGKYDYALQNAEHCLALHGDLLDYNTLDASATLPMPLTLTNKEIILNGNVGSDPLGSQLLSLNNAGIDSTLYQLYSTGDLRQTVCFKAGTTAGMKLFKGSYSKLTIAFQGIATDEVYLIKAECQARAGNVAGAMDALNTLLKARWKSGMFSPLAASSADDALTKVLIERRKELVMRGTRWADLRRLNKDSKFAITLYRNISGQKYALPPNDPRYTWQIPDNVIALNPGMQQNPH